MDKNFFSECTVLQDETIFCNCSARDCKAAVHALGLDGVIVNIICTPPRIITKSCNLSEIVSSSVKRKADDILERPSKNINCTIENYSHIVNNMRVRDINCVRRNINVIKLQKI